MKNKDFVARAVNGIKALSKDAHISKRYILSIGRAKAKFLMSQKWDELTLNKEDTLISQVKCFKLEKQDTISCDIVEFKTCKDLMKSVNKVPETISGKVGLGILSVASIDGNIDYNYATPNAIRNKSKRRFSHKVNQNFFYIRDGYMYLPNSTNELIDIDMLAIDGIQVEDVSECSKCEECLSAWDHNFICPDRFVDLVLRETMQEIASIHRTSVEDTNPNWDSNQKGKTTD